MKFRLGKKGLIAIIVVVAIIVLSSSSVVVALAANNWSFSNDGSLTTVASEEQGGVEVLDYTSTRPDITGGKVEPDDMEFADKMWFEYAEYESTPYLSETSDNYYEVFMPTDVSKYTIMAIRDYQPEGVDSNTAISINWKDMVPFIEMIVAGNTAVAVSGGVIQGVAGAVTSAVVVGTIWGTMDNENIIKNSMYYGSPDDTGIPGDDEWGGITQKGFYTASSLTISMTESSSFSVAKTNTLSSKVSATGELSMTAEEELKDPLGLAKLAFKESIGGKFSSEFSYGLNYQQSQQASRSESISRTFSARTDDEVKNVAWKLCEYCAKIPLKVVVYNNEIDKKPIDSAYIQYNYLYGVCRVFANGYIEHWNTGELVSYADFFDGFVTAKQVVSNYKEQAKKDAKK